MGKSPTELSFQLISTSGRGVCGFPCELTAPSSGAQVQQRPGEILCVRQGFLA